MTNQQARMIGSAIVMVAGAIIMTVSVADMQPIGGVVFIFGGICFCIDWFGSHKGDKS